MVLAGSRPAPDGTGIPQEYSASAGTPARAAHRRGFRSGLAAPAGAGCLLRRLAVYARHRVSGDQRGAGVDEILPGGQGRLGPPRAIEARVFTPMLAILPGYCAESAAMVPSLSNPLT